MLENIIIQNPIERLTGHQEVHMASLGYLNMHFLHRQKNNTRRISTKHAEAYEINMMQEW